MKGAIFILVCGVLIAGSIVFFTRSRQVTSLVVPDVHNTNIVDGKQIIEIQARGGYSPQISTAKAGIPTIIRFRTTGSFDCSTSIRIPSLSITKILPQTGTTDIEIGTQQAGSLLGTCGMGMYRFQINFEA